MAHIHYAKTSAPLYAQNPQKREAVPFSNQALTNAVQWSESVCVSSYDEIALHADYANTHPNASGAQIYIEWSGAFSGAENGGYNHGLTELSGHSIYSQDVNYALEPGARYRRSLPRFHVRSNFIRFGASEVGAPGGTLSLAMRMYRPPRPRGN